MAAVLARSIKGNLSESGVNGELTRPSVDKRTGQSIAIKVIDVESAEDEVEDIILEISILSELNSPYITKYHGSFLKGSDLWIIMEFCAGGSCSDLLKSGLIQEDYITIILRELLMGLEYLHADQKLHRDIKGKSPSSFYHTTFDMECSGEYLAGIQWSSQACRFWRFWPALSHDDEEEYLCWHAFLDGS